MTLIHSNTLNEVVKLWESKILTYINPIRIYFNVDLSLRS